MSVFIPSICKDCPSLRVRHPLMRWDREFWVDDFGSKWHEWNWHMNWFAGVAYCEGDKAMLWSYTSQDRHAVQCAYVRGQRVDLCDRNAKKEK